jgi:hypothetical protein
MTVTRTIGNYHDSSNARIRKIGELAAGVYVTTGEVLSAATLGLGRVEALLVEPFTNGSVILIGRYDYAAGRMKIFDMAGVETTNATDLSAYTARFEAIGAA